MKRTKVKTIILLVLTCLVLLVTGTYAAYTNVKSAKRVIIAGSTTREMRFSSNILSDHTEGTAFHYRPISADTNDDAFVGLTICNYPQNNITKVSQDTITYTISFQLIDSQSNLVNDSTLLEKLSVQETMTGSEPYISLSETREYSGKILAGNTASRHLYTIHCSDVSAISSYSLRIQATATSPILPMSLAADLKFTSSDTLETSWTGTIVEKSEYGDAGSLDAFNFRIQGSAAGTLELSWDQSVSISPWFIEELKNDLVDDTKIISGGNSIRFPVGQPNQPTSYQIQFYRENGITDSWPSITAVFPAP